MRCTNLEMLMVLIVPRHWHWLKWFGKRITRSISASFVCGSSLELRVSDLWIWLIYAMQFEMFWAAEEGVVEGRSKCTLHTKCLFGSRNRAGEYFDIRCEVALLFKYIFLYITIFERQSPGLWR